MRSRRAVGAAVISLVGDPHARCDIRANIKRRFKLRCVAYLATGQVEIERIAIEIGLQMDFRRKAAPRAAECLILLPPFAPAAET